MAIKFNIKDVKDNPNQVNQVLIVVDIFDGASLIGTKDIEIDGGSQMTAKDIEDILKDKLQALKNAKTKVTNLSSLIGKDIL